MGCERDPTDEERRRGVVKTCPKGLCLTIFLSIFGLISLIVIISVIASSFANVDEGQACMQYSWYTGKLEDDVVLEPTNTMVGPSSGFLCYPKTVQEIEFTKGGTGPNAILGTRTQEGLFINLDLHIEYRLVPAEMKSLFLKFGPWENVVSNLTIVARSELRNTASKYGGLAYLAGDRGNIAANMKVDLAIAFSPFSIEVNEVNIRSISLTPEFELAFAAVRAVKLAASKALQTRDVDITQERRANESAVITLLANRETTILGAHAKVTKARLEREAQVTAAQTEAITQKLKAESARATRLTQARSEVNKAASERLARLTEARVRNSELTLKAERSRGVELIEAATEVGKARAARVAATTAAQTEFAKLKIQLAKERESAITAARGRLAAAQLARIEVLLAAQAKLDATRTRETARSARARTLAHIEVLKGNATAAKVAADASASLESERGMKLARVQLLQQLQAQSGMSAKQVLRFLHLGALANVAGSPSTTLFMDYAKVPLMLEAQQAALASSEASGGEGGPAGDQKVAAAVNVNVNA